MPPRKILNFRPSEIISGAVLRQKLIAEIDDPPLMLTEACSLVHARALELAPIIVIRRPIARYG